MTLAARDIQTRSLELSDAQFARLAAIAEHDAGLALPASKRQMVQSRLARFLKNSGHVGFDTYIADIERHPTGPEREKLISLLTTNVSSFFREKHHFDTLASDVLPGLIAAAQSGRRVRIWSAGCSTGQEPYSLAMLALSLAPGLAKTNFRILASDIDKDVLRSALIGVYPGSEDRSIPTGMKADYLEAATDGSDTFRVADTVRELVTFRPLNLIGTWPMKGRFDVIFCRNVVIYFDETVQAALWPRFADALVDGGWLFLGHSERLNTSGVKTFAPTGVTTFRKLPLPEGVA